MHKLFLSLFSTICYLTYTNCDQICNPTDFKSNIDSLPALPTEFEARLELTLPLKEKTIDMTVLYAWNDKRAETSINEPNRKVKSIFYYDKNKFYQISPGKKCKIQKINETDPSILYFGLAKDPEGFLNMKEINDVLHFNNNYNSTLKFPHSKENQTTWRGIPVNHYRSCQDWPEKKSNFLIDYYFKVPEFQQGVEFDETYKEIPVAAVIEGFVGGTRKFRNEYNFFEFRTEVQKRAELFTFAEGLYCEGEAENQGKQDPIEIPETFSVTEETIISGQKAATTTKIFYSYGASLTRFDVVAVRPSNNALTKYSIIQDFNSGVKYTIDKELESCEISPLGSNEFSYTTLSGTEKAFKIKSPQQIFYLDQTYYFAGEHIERGIKCDMYVSNRTDFKMEGLTVQPAYFIFEILFKNLLATNQGSDGLEPIVPVAIKISAPGINETFVTNFYDFDSNIPSVSTFDVSSCYSLKQKKEFAIRFKYQNGLEMDIDFFNMLFEQKTEKAFIIYLLDTLKIYNFSPLRIISPIVRPHKDGFTIFTGILDSAPAMKQFQKSEKVKVDETKAKFKIASTSAERCAQQCLEDSTISSNKYACLSFDFCSTKQFCSFYNFSLSTDPDVVSFLEPECDHYSKTVELVDAVSKEALYREIEGLVGRNEFSLMLLKDDETLVTKFDAVDIYPVTLGASSNDPYDIFFAQSSFYERFLVFSFDIDFNVSAIEQDPNLFIRKRIGVSIDECARLCMTEPAFRCESLSYEASLTECKWSSFISYEDEASEKYFVSDDSAQGFAWFIRDPFYDYTEYSDKVTSLINLKAIDIEVDNECPFLCTSEKSFTCRSFNLCKQGDKYKCLLSENHSNNPEKDPQLVYSPICSHYSRKTIFDFKLVPQIQLNVSPKSKILNTTVDNCAQLCTDSDNFFCRSFDFFANTSNCYLYTENLNDINFKDVVAVENFDCSHYSRLYLTENGMSDLVKPNVKTVSNKYSGGGIFGIILALTIVSLAIGSGLSFAYLKYFKKPTLLPRMEFVNPNYVKN